MMNVQWDYTQLAKAYLSRPEYAESCIDYIQGLVEHPNEAQVCDIGAGTGHLTLALLRAGFTVSAIEPNTEMRQLGQRQTADYKNVAWQAGLAEQTGQASNHFDVVTFGSSFNVCDQKAALLECARVLKSRGWFACLWNHRDLGDPLQKQIEEAVHSRIPNYDYGARRQDQTSVIADSGLFEAPIYVEGQVVHHLAVEQAVDAWRSHATLQRQAGEQFDDIVSEIGRLIQAGAPETIAVPYHTRMWVARLK